MAPSRIPRPLSRVRPRPRARTHARNNRTTRNAPSGNFRCFVKAARGKNPLAKFAGCCSTPKKNMRILKEHAKSKHKCDCPEREKGICLNPAHLTSDQLAKIEKTTLRGFGSHGEQWVALAHIVDETAQLPHPHQPTTCQLVNLSWRPPPDFSDRLQQRFNKEAPGLVGPFYAQFRILVDEVSRTGATAEDDHFAGHESDATLAVSPHNSVSSSDITNDTRDDVVMETNGLGAEAVAAGAPKPAPPASGAAVEPDVNVQNQQAPGAANDSTDPAKPHSSEAMDFPAPSPPNHALEDVDDQQILMLIDDTYGEQPPCQPSRLI